MGYYLCHRATSAVLHGPYPQLVHAFAHHIRGETVVMHRGQTGELKIVSY